MSATISSVDLDAAIIGYLRFLDKEQKEAILNLMKVLLPAEDAEDRWNDPDFVAEMDRRLEDYKNGKLNCVTWEEVKASALDVIKDVRKEKER